MLQETTSNKKIPQFILWYLLWRRFLKDADKAFNKQDIFVFIELFRATSKQKSQAYYQISFSHHNPIFCKNMEFQKNMEMQLTSKSAKAMLIM